MDRWRKAYTNFGLEDLDLRWERVLVYVMAVAFWVNLAAWLLTWDGLIPGINSPLEWLMLALLSVPGNARVVFLIALGPNRRVEWTTFFHNPDARPAPRRRWWKIRARIRRNGAGRRRAEGQGRSRRTRPWAATWTSVPGAGQVPETAAGRQSRYIPLGRCQPSHCRAKVVRKPAPL